MEMKRTGKDRNGDGGRRGQESKVDSVRGRWNITGRDEGIEADWCYRSVI